MTAVPAKRAAYRHHTLDTSRDKTTAATVSKMKKGRIGAIYGPAASVHYRNHLPVTRKLIGAVAGKLFPNPVVKLNAPPCVDVVLRRKGKQVLVHLINTSGMQLAEDYAVTDYVPPLGPMELTVKIKRRPASVKVVGDDKGFTKTWNAGKLRVKLDSLSVHSVVVIE